MVSVRSSTVRPRIGMVGDRRPASFGAWREVELSSVWNHYVEAVSGAGGAPLIFPVDEYYADAPERALEVVAGLLLTGGRDLDATTYGEASNPANDPGDPLRDRLELGLARTALERDLPVLAVCRGMQLLNVALGGGIAQHLDDPGDVHRGRPGTFVDHEIEVVAGTRLAAILGETPAPVRSHHHQGVAPLADRLAACAHSPDGLVEAAESPDHRFCVAVLWHPEENLAAGGLRLYEALVTAARAEAPVPA